MWFSLDYEPRGIKLSQSLPCGDEILSGPLSWTFVLMEISCLKFFGCLFVRNDLLWKRKKTDAIFDVWILIEICFLPPFICLYK